MLAPSPLSLPSVVQNKGQFIEQYMNKCQEKYEKSTLKGHLHALVGRARVALIEGFQSPETFLSMSIPLALRAFDMDV